MKYIIILMVFVVGLFFGSRAELARINNNCEIIGNSSGQKWLECDIK